MAVVKQNKGKPPQPAGSGSEPAKRLCQLIATQPFFKGLKPQQFQLLAGLAMEREFKPGEYIVREGDPANRFYLVLEGEVDLHFESKGQGRIPIQLLGPGDDLGWSWLFPPYYFNGTAQAVEFVKTIFFYGTRLRQLCEDDHDLGYEIMKRVAAVAIRNLNSSRRYLERLSAKEVPVRVARK